MASTTSTTTTTTTKKATGPALSPISPPSLKPLLFSFPTPPTHIPHSPLVSRPLGLPPSLPLPPLPQEPSPLWQLGAQASSSVLKRKVSNESTESASPRASGEWDDENESTGTAVTSVEDQPTAAARIPTATSPNFENWEHAADPTSTSALSESVQYWLPTANDTSDTPLDTPITRSSISNDARRRHPKEVVVHRSIPVGQAPAINPVSPPKMDKAHPHASRGRPPLRDSSSSPDIPTLITRTPTPSRSRARAAARASSIPRRSGDGDDEDMDDFSMCDEEEENIIDLHTPLPHLMLRAGLLSPHSKLLPRPAITPEPPKSKRHSPTFSLSSKKSHHPRDTRDTAKRRQRHKDGRLLRGGIGLTTGLGWSDSEDEDAPSELTHRLSRLAPSLSRKTSLASTTTSYSTQSAYSTLTRMSSTMSLSAASAISRKSSASAVMPGTPTTPTQHSAPRKINFGEGVSTKPTAFVSQGRESFVTLYSPSTPSTRLSSGSSGRLRKTSDASRSSVASSVLLAVGGRRVSAASDVSSSGPASRRVSDASVQQPSPGARTSSADPTTTTPQRDSALSTASTSSWVATRTSNGSFSYSTRTRTRPSTTTTTPPPRNIASPTPSFSLPTRSGAGAYASIAVGVHGSGTLEGVEEEDQKRQAHLLPYLAEVDMNVSSGESETEEGRVSPTRSVKVPKYPYDFPMPPPTPTASTKGAVSASTSVAEAQMQVQGRTNGVAPSGLKNATPSKLKTLLLRTNPSSPATPSSTDSVSASGSASPKPTPSRGRTFPLPSTPSSPTPLPSRAFSASSSRRSGPPAALLLVERQRVNQGLIATGGDGSPPPLEPPSRLRAPSLGSRERPVSKALPPLPLNGTRSSSLSSTTTGLVPPSRIRTSSNASSVRLTPSRLKAPSALTSGAAASSPGRQVGVAM